MVGDQLHAPSRFTPNTHWIGNWVGPTRRSENFWDYWDSKSGPSPKQPYCAILVPSYTKSFYLSLLKLRQINLNSVAFSPQSNYTDWSTDIGRRISVPTSADRSGVALSALLPPPPPLTAVNLSFIDRIRYFFFQVAPHLSSRGWMDPVPYPLLHRKSGSAGNRTRDLRLCGQELCPLDHRDGLMD
jgi:hypothetical protein